MAARTRDGLKLESGAAEARGGFFGHEEARHDTKPIHFHTEAQRTQRSIHWQPSSDRTNPSTIEQISASSMPPHETDLGSRFVLVSSRASSWPKRIVNPALFHSMQAQKKPEAGSLRLARESGSQPRFPITARARRSRRRAAAGLPSPSSRPCARGGPCRSARRCRRTSPRSCRPS